MPEKLTLVLMAGLPGAGKTVLTLALGQALGWPVIDKDTLKSPLLALGVPESVAGPASYDLLLALARDLLVEQRLSVILDSPAAYAIVLARAGELAGSAGADLKVVLCLAPRDVRSRRVAARAGRPSQQASLLDTAEDGQERFGHLPANTLRVDTTRPLAELVTDVLTYLPGPREPRSWERRRGGGWPLTPIPCRLLGGRTAQLERVLRCWRG